MNDLLLLLHLTGKFHKQKYLSLIDKYPALSINDCCGSFLGIDWDIYLKIFESVKGNDYLTILDDNYPQLLQNISNSPLVIFYTGNLEILSNKCISVVGSRSPSAEGIKNTQKLVDEISALGVTVVSGMAMGIDAIAHSSAIKYQSSTIAVLASAVNQPTPVINTSLYNNILNKNGLILSENYENGKVIPEFFPKRNRLIAGVSSSTIVIEAKMKSGSLITAKLARGYDRDVYAIPTSVNSAYLGCNHLIYTQIAEIIPSIMEVTNQLGLLVGHKTNSMKDDSLDSQAESIINFLIKNPGVTADIICQELNLNIVEFLTEIESLKLSGRVIDEFGRFLVYNNSNG